MIHDPMATKHNAKAKIRLRDHDDTKAGHMHDMAFRFLEHGAYQKAIETYTQIIVERSEDKSAYYHRSIAHARSNDIEKAIADLTKVVELDRDFAKAYIYRAVLYCMNGDFDKSMTDFKRVRATGGIGQVYGLLEEQGMLCSIPDKDAKALTEVLLSNPGAVGMGLELGFG